MLRPYAILGAATALRDTWRARVAQVDLPYPAAAWGERRYHTTELMLPLPNALPAGHYTLGIGLYDPQTGQRITLDTPIPALTSQFGPEALTLTTLMVP